MSPPSAPPGDKKSDDRVGTVLSDRYRLDELLGVGGMGRVYAAEHVMMRKRLAVKVLHRELVTVPEVVKRFEREAMAAANIEHPNVATATDFGKLADGSVFMAMEFVEGQSLRDEIAKGPMRCERALRIGRQIASALASAHALDIVHRDLKPENVMLVAKGGEADFVKVLDFGIAKVPIGGAGTSGGNPITKVGMVFGTPEYMAPEQALGQAVDGRADLYALGVIVYEMLAGRRPFSGSSQTGILGQQLSRPAPPFIERAPGAGIPPAVEQVVLRLLEREAVNRYQTADEAVSAIEALMGMGTGAGQLFTQLGGSASSSLSGTGSIPDFDPGGQSAFSSTLDQEPAPEPASGAFVDAAEVSRIPFPVSASGPMRSEELTHRDPALSPLPPGAAAQGRPTDATDRPWLFRPVPAERAGIHGWLPGPLVAFTAWVDEKRRRLPDPMNRVPALAYLGSVMVLALVGLLVGVLGVLSFSGARKPLPQLPPKASVSAAPVVVPFADRASAAELKAAGAGGLEALAKLAKRFPRDSAVCVALARAERDAKHPVEAVRAVKRALDLSPELSQNADVSAVLWVTAQDAQAREPTFALLEGPMGSRGAEIAYDFVATAKVNAAVRQRSEKFISSARFQKVASPPLRIAAKLRDARKCNEIHELLDEAVESGDERSLPYLRQFQNTKSCKVRRRRVDCWPCLRADNKLIAAIEACASRKEQAAPSTK